MQHFFLITDLNISNITSQLPSVRCRAAGDLPPFIDISITSARKKSFLQFHLWQLPTGQLEVCYNICNNSLSNCKSLGYINYVVLSYTGCAVYRTCPQNLQPPPSTKYPIVQSHINRVKFRNLLATMAHQNLDLLALGCSLIKIKI